MQITEDGKNLFPWQHNYPRGYVFVIYFVCYICLVLVRRVWKMEDFDKLGWIIAYWNQYKIYFCAYCHFFLIPVWHYSLEWSTPSGWVQFLLWKSILIHELHFFLASRSQLISRGCLLLIKVCSTKNLKHKYMVAEHVLYAVPPHAISSAFPQWMHIAYIFRAIKLG